ncbi:hypothetical protein AB0M02_22820 [Actinoplanes sp. NPDC051861]|uniref:hypothetical protein n=1 Tax=Actinoplanes sp. NPDC051861 TaxID=3155170 RepID=UPI00341F1E47
MGFSLFDASRYDREVLRPLRGTHGQLPPGDLVARYAVDPGMDADALRLHLTRMRAWWAQRAEAPDFRAAVCRLLLQADEDLQATVGPAMEDPDWWREQARASPATAAEPAEDFVAAEQPAAEPVAEPDWRADARAQFWAALSALDRVPVAAGAARPAARERVAEREPAASPLPGLRVVPVTAEGERCRVNLSWPGDLPEGVRVRYSRDPSPFPPGAPMPWSQAAQWGRDLHAEAVREDGRTVLAATVPTGYHVYVPFQISGETAVPGRGVALGVAAPVRRLRLDRSGAGARVTWEWPDQATAVQVAWTAGEVTEREVVSQARYTTAGGFTIEDARGGGRVEVRALTPVGDGTAYSPAVSASIAAAPAAVAYDLQRRRRLGAVDLVVTLIADRDCAGLEVDVVVSSAEVIPLDASRGEVHARLGPLDLTAGVEDRHVLPWPRADRPYWIRCFFRAPYPVFPKDPATDRMRIA